MATQADAKQVEAVIRYTFRSRDHLLQALTAAGAEEDNHDGNRKLALLGNNLIRFMLSFAVYETTSSRSQITDLETSFISNAQRATIAKANGIDKCIKYSTKPGAQSSKVLAFAISAIVGAVHIDSKEFDAPWKVALKLGLVSGPFRTHSYLTGSRGDTVDPAMLSLYQDTTVEDTGASLDRITDSIGYYETNKLPSDGLLNQTIIETSSNPASQNDLATLSSTCTDFLADDTTWTSLEMDLREVSAGGTVDWELASGEKEYERIDPSIQHSRRGLSSVLGDGKENSDRPSRKRVSTSVNNQRKRTKSCNQGVPSVLDERLKNFLEQETQRCQSFDRELPEQTFFSQQIQKSLAGMGAQANMLAKLLVYIASPESIVTLQRIVRTYRMKSVSLVSWSSTPDLSKKERFHLIELLGDKIAWCRLLRMFHVLELYRACGGTQTGSTDGFILTTGLSFEDPRKQAGNPRHAAETQITKKMMEEIFPHIYPETDQYPKKLASLKWVRIFGHRLHTLVANFGIGVLGLLWDDGLTGLGITEKAILRPTDGSFREFIEVLRQSQGDLLCKFGAAVQKFLDPLIYGALPPEPFAMENRKPEHVLQCPKGSRELLEQIG